MKSEKEIRLFMIDLKKHLLLNMEMGYFQHDHSYHTFNKKV